MILTLVEHQDGQPADTSLEALTLARRLVGGDGEGIEAIVIGDGASGTADVLGSYGVSRIHAAQDERLDPFAPDAWASVLTVLMTERDPSAVLASGTDRGNEVMARLAARAGLPLAANCTDVEPGDPFLVTRMRWGGSLLEEALIDARVTLLTVAPHGVRAEPAPLPLAPEVLEVSPTLSERDLAVRVTATVPPPAGKVSLAEARVVVGGGRGVGSAAAFRALEELADLLGGAVGCSRVVTSLGWRPHSDQVGQTGVRIAPDVYIACGISGAIQHMVGCKAAKTIIAINTDAEAPIVTKAAYAVIGDVGQIVPAVTAELRKNVAR